MNGVYLLLGSNMGSRIAYIKKALEQVKESCGSIETQSSYYETEAWGKQDQAAFINMVICINTALSSIDLLSAIQKIEDDAGRQRNEKWGQRTLDIDILLYGDQIIDTIQIKVPHPFIQSRRFTLVPLSEIAAGIVHPKLKKTISQLLAECPDKLEVKKYQP
jgi:2-amino-4-hydroxy-6-hydroxymethyldihydropteridine diphosphokinase